MRMFNALSKDELAASKGAGDRGGDRGDEFRMSVTDLGFEGSEKADDDAVDINPAKFDGTCCLL